MSDRSPLLYLTDIEESIEAILLYVDKIPFETFKEDRMRFSAVIREFEIIGEAVGKLPEDMKTEHPEVHWQDIKDFRNILVHEYFGIDLEIVWNVIADDLPPLHRVVKDIIRSFKVKGARSY